MVGFNHSFKPHVHFVKSTEDVDYLWNQVFFPLTEALSIILPKE